MFLKKEIYVGQSMDEFNSISEHLYRENIKCFTRTDYHNHNASIGRGAGVGRSAAKNENPTYYIYVRRKDYIRAQESISVYFH